MRVVCPDNTVCEVGVPGVLTKVKVAGLIVWVSTADVLPALFASPP